MRGDHTHGEYSYADIRVKGCDLKTLCQDESIIEGFLINLLLLDSHVCLDCEDSKDYEVLNYSLEGRHFIYLDSNLDKTLAISFMLNQVELDLAIIKWFWRPKNISFVAPTDKFLYDRPLNPQFKRKDKVYSTFKL